MDILISVILLLVLCAVALFVINEAPFLDAKYKELVKWVVAALVLVWLLLLVSGQVHVPRLR